MNDLAQKSVRRCRFAGQFFSGDGDVLARAVDGFLAAAAQLIPAFDPAPKAIISPHAGYRFSGPVAGRAFQSARAGGYDGVVILSPSHRHQFEGIALPAAAGIETPLGVCRVDPKLRQAVLGSGLVHIEDAAHDHEHGVETQLPFVQRCFRDATILPVVVGNATGDQVVSLLQLVARQENEDRLLIVISSDLSHFLADEVAQEKDQQTAAMIEKAQGAKIGPSNACGWKPLQGMLTMAQQDGLRISRLGMTNSSAVTGDAIRVVGYGAWALLRAETAKLPTGPRRRALHVARQSLEAYSKGGKRPFVDVASFHSLLQGTGASFVTLKIAGRLRGCIGSVTAHRPLISDISHNAVSAGYEDPRFKKLTPQELTQVQLKIAILSAPHEIRFSSQDDLLAQLQPGKDGLILQTPQHRGLFLPMVWEGLPKPQDFVNGLKVKAGLDKDFWSDEIKIFRFTSEDFEEEQAAPV